MDLRHHLLWMGIKGFSLSEEEKTGFQRHGVSGLILFKRNVESLPQLLALCQEIKSLNPPPLMMMDREGGKVDRLCHLPDFPPWPEPTYLSHHFSLVKIQQIAFYMACEMRALGLCLNLAPVVDVPSVKSELLKGRLLGENPKAVSDKALAWIKGFTQAGLASCVKHFPGHGGVTTDSHFELPLDQRTLDLLEKHDLIPFQKAIEAGVDLVMTAHVAYPACSNPGLKAPVTSVKPLSLLPATLCPFLLKTLLRQKMGFKGLVISDDLDMKALTRKGLSERAIMQQALSAGVDILLKCEPPKDILAYLDMVSSIFKEEAIKNKNSMDMKINRFFKFQQKYTALQPVKSFKQLKQTLAKAHEGYAHFMT